MRQVPNKSAEEVGTRLTSQPRELFHGYESEES